MIAKEIADILDGMEYGEEISAQDLQYAKVNRAVIVFGASDDLMEFRGAIEDELTLSYGDGFAYLNKNGLLRNKCNNADCPYFIEKRLQAKTIAAVWDCDGYSWIYTTEIPHETFEILDRSLHPEGTKYCRGIVFSMESL